MNTKLNPMNRQLLPFFIAFISTLYFFSVYLLVKPVIDIAFYFLITFIIMTFISNVLLKKIINEVYIFSIFIVSYVGLFIGLLLITLPKFIFLPEEAWFIIIEITAPLSFLLMAIISTIICNVRITNKIDFYSILIRNFIFYFLLAVSVFIAGLVPILLMNPILARG